MEDTIFRKQQTFLRKIKGIFGRFSVGELDFADGLLDDLRKIALFEFVDVGGDVVGGVGGGDGGAKLRDNGSAVTQWMVMPVSVSRACQTAS